MYTSVRYRWVLWMFSTIVLVLTPCGRARVHEHKVSGVCYDGLDDEMEVWRCWLEDLRRDQIWDSDEIRVNNFK